MSDFVSLSYIEEYNVDIITEKVKSALGSINFNKFKPKMKVMLKICAPISCSPDEAKTTNPAVVCGVANALTDMGLSVVVAESPYGSYSNEELDKVYLNTGMLEMANSSKSTLNNNLKTFELENPNGQASKSFTLLDAINDVDFIVNIGKLKIDENLGFLGATANLFGLIPGELKALILNRFDTLKQFNNYIIDLYECLKNKVVLNIVDGIVSLEANNNQRMLYCLALCENAYKLDACLCDILGIDLNNTYLKQAEERKLIQLTHPYKVLGEEKEKFVVPDFEIGEFNEETPIHKNKFKQKHYFNLTQQRVKINQKHCKGCSICSKICPTGAIMMRYDKENELYAEIDYSKCIYCFKCFAACPYRVVEVKKPINYKILEKQITKYNEK